MSDVTRAVALAEASKLNLKSASEVLAVAQVYDAYLNGAEAPARVSTPGKEPSKPVGGKPTGTRKPVKGEDEVVKDALARQRQQAEAVDAEGGEDGVPVSKEGVQTVIARLLKANKRKEAIGLLKEFDAASAKGVKEDDYAEFIEKAQSLLSGAGDEAEDLTA